MGFAAFPQGGAAIFIGCDASLDRFPTSVVHIVDNLTVVYLICYHLAKRHLIGVPQFYLVHTYPRKGVSNGSPGKHPDSSHASLSH